jgi:malto-oligosyltrehalose trehalohydrolase/4-alpha-glucanotransferase
MPFGAEPRSDGTVRFRLWAPSHQKIRLELDEAAEPLTMEVIGDGWHELVTDRARPGTRYGFVLPADQRVPDPASRHQPKDVHGPSEVVDPTSYTWADMDWRGRPWEEAVVYELHIGAFTPEGTFQAAIGKLEHLVALGVTAIEIMPIADFPGARNWGYDGVLPYAPDASYGRPEDLKALVDAAHARGLMVLLDVVYNHFGPEGAYLHTIAPQTFTDRHKTPWGAAINFDGPASGPVREYFIHNAIYWVEEFNLDGLRLDAVHAILDDSPQDILTELAERVRASTPDRHIHLILENEENAVRRLERREGGPEGLNDGDIGPRWYTAQWNDDVHHVLHVATTGEDQGYYADYKGDSQKLGRALAEGFAFQGEMMPYRGHPRGEPSAKLPPTAFVAFIQNHDQIGNRPFGDRLTAIASPAAVRAAAAVYLLLPQVPMLFMGEEWAAAQPFPFFCDFGPELAGAVRDGRRREFARFPAFQDPANRERIPDPTAEETFASAKLAWDDVLREPHAAWLDWYCRVLSTRHAEIVPRLGQIRSGGRFDVIGAGAVVVRWPVGEAGAELILAANLSAEAVSGFPPLSGRAIWREGEQDESGLFGPWAVRWSLLDGRDEGGGEEREAESEAGSATLDRLAERMGIEPEFRDARGKLVQTSATTKRNLLAAMGQKAAAEAEARESLAGLERADWLKPLPPIQVFRAGSDATVVELVLPAGTGHVTWHLKLEDGEQRAGRVPFGQLERIAARIVDGRTLERRSLILAGALPVGYHQLTVGPHGGAMTLAVAPSRCWLPDALEQGRRLWGIAAQLYLVRTANNWGIGDFTDLRRLVELAASQGADVIGLNPLHAMFLDNPGHASPYSPASRLMLNILNIDVTAIPGLQNNPEVRALIASEKFQQKVASCRAARLVHYTEVTKLKLKILEAQFAANRAAAAFHAGRTAVSDSVAGCDAPRLSARGAEHADLRSSDADSEIEPADLMSEQQRWQAFMAFRRDRGEALERTCLFLALREHFALQDPGLADWHNWPEPYRRPASRAVQRFRNENEYRVEFLAWLQWLADEQLGAASAAASRQGMAVGLYRDLAVGADRSGAETWANADAVVSDAQVGAPPDIYNPGGQDWGLPPFHPQALREQGYRDFIELIRANMRHAGGLRIDHVMGLRHLWWVPVGKQPADGAYVQYPMEDLIGILALESHRQRCLVVGEDLGTVPEGFRERMAEANILSYRVLFFEQDPSGAFREPSGYPGLALAVAGSHDLPTLRAWWDSSDLDLKAQLELYPSPEVEADMRQTRAADQEKLVKALRSQGLLAPDEQPDARRLNRAIHAFLARSAAVLAMAQIDDLTGEDEPVNVPTTSTEHPNWRRRLRMTLEELAADPDFNEIAETFNAERGGARHHG